MQMLKSTKQRIPQYDLMRAVAMFLVVYVHSSFMFSFAPDSDSAQAGLYWYTSVLALVCNSLFFMLSGKFNLEQATKLESGGYRAFYIKKIIDLLVPVILYAITFWVLTYAGIKLFGAWDSGVSFWDYGAFFSTTHQLLVSSWWFVPMIFSLMIFTPFLGRMLTGLKAGQVYALLVVIFGCATIIAIERLLGFTTVLSKFFIPVFGIWASFYILGYAIDKANISPKTLRMWYVLAGTLVAIFGIIFLLLPQLSLSPDGGPLPVWNAILSAAFYPAFAIALFLLFKRISITGNKVRGVVEFLGNRAFGIYLIHFCFFFSYLHLLPDWLRGSDGAIDGIARRLIITAAIYLASLAVATLVDLLLVNPIQRKLKSKLLG